MVFNEYSYGKNSFTDYWIFYSFKRRTGKKECRSEAPHVEELSRTNVFFFLVFSVYCICHDYDQTARSYDIYRIFLYPFYLALFYCAFDRAIIVVGELRSKIEMEKVLLRYFCYPLPHLTLILTLFSPFYAYYLF